jgi:hypothetical protein
MGYKRLYTLTGILKTKDIVFIKYAYHLSIPIPRYKHLWGGIRWGGKREYLRDLDLEFDLKTMVMNFHQSTTDASHFRFYHEHKNQVSSKTAQIIRRQFHTSHNSWLVLHNKMSSKKQQVTQSFAPAQDWEIHGQMTEARAKTEFLYSGSRH